MRRASHSEPRDSVTRTGLQASDPAKAPYGWSLSIADPRKLIKIAVSIANVAIQ